jgi:CRP-like cAMP-binding protein
MHFREFSADLKVKIRTYYTLSWRKSGTLYKESEILEELPSFLRKDTLVEIGSKAKLHTPIFQGIDDECIGFLFTCMTRIDFMENQCIYVKGDHASDMYLISSGTVNLQYDSLPGQRCKSKSKIVKPAKVAEAGDIFGEAALFPDVSPPYRLETATATSWVIVFVLPAAEVPKIAAQYPYIIDKLKELCQLKVADDRTKGFENTVAEEVALLSCGVVQHCPLKSMIAQMQRDLLIIKEQMVLNPASGEGGSRIMKLLVKSQFLHHQGGDHDLTSISSVISKQGELLCIEHTTPGISSEGLQSLGFIVPGMSSYRVMESEEVRRLVGKSSKGAQLFGCSIVTYSQGVEALGGAVDIPARRKAGLGPASVVRLFTWLEEELEGLVEYLDALLETAQVGTLKQQPLVLPSPLEIQGMEPASPSDVKGDFRLSEGE